MALTQQDYGTLRTAYSQYSYPPQVYDLAAHRIVDLPGMAEVEEYIGTRLHSGDPVAVREGLLSALTWGFAGFGYRQDRLNDFLAGATDRQVGLATVLFGPSTPTSFAGGELVYRLSKLGLPQLSMVAFSTKVVMFWDPTRFPVLDSKVANLFATLPQHSPLAKLTRQPTYIPVTRHNAGVYDHWSVACRDIATKGGIGKGRAVDAERAFFHLVKQDRAETAGAILARWD